MEPTRDLGAVFELFDLAVRMRAQRFRREHPGASDADVEACVQAWLLDRPGAPHGDAPGRLVAIPRHV